MDKIIERIMDAEKWPSIQLSENLELLNEMADHSFYLNTFEGKLAATLMYHQIVEAMCMHLLEDCHFFIQLSVYPTEIEFSVPFDKMLGFYIEELKSTICFSQKEEFIGRVKELNTYRIDVVHKMRRSNLNMLSSELSAVKKCFDEIYNLYDSIQDDFRVHFHGFKKEVFIDYLEEDEIDRYFQEIAIADYLEQAKKS
ncbi:MAG: hypothetical protein RR063_09725 [Anaerovoracaceae bacterium]